MNIPAVSYTNQTNLHSGFWEIVFLQKKSECNIDSGIHVVFFELHHKIKQKIHLMSWTLLPILVQIKMWNVYIRRRVRTHSNGNNSHDSLSKVSLKVLCFVHDFTHKITPWNILFIWKWNINMEMSKDMAQIFIRQCIHRNKSHFKTNKNSN